MATARECIKKVIIENSKGRKLVFIEEFKALEEFLTQEGVKPDLHISMKKENVDNEFYYDISMLEKRCKEFYVVVPFEISEEISRILNEYGYKLIKDYCYLQPMHKKVSGVKEYIDGFNNQCNFAPENLLITFAGANAKVHIGKNVNINGNVEIEIYDDAELIFGEGAFIEGKFRLGDRANIKIGCKVGGKFQAVSVAEDACVTVGDSTTFTSSAVIIVANGCVQIGTDCMIAANNTFWCGDGHAVYDVKTNKVINLDKAKNSIILGNHVWIGTKSTILSRTEIGTGSIVGAGSVVKGEYPNNCMLAGNPSKKKKTDVFWCRDPKGDFKESEKQYFNKTVVAETEYHNGGDLPVSNRIVAIVPIKMNNERLPGKNTKELGDKPLIHYVQDYLNKTEEISEKYVFCSNETIKEFLLPGIEFMKRDEYLDLPSSNFTQIFGAFMEKVDADIYVYAHATAPFVSLETINECINAVKSGEFDSAFCAEKIQDYLWKDGEPMNFDATNLPRSQDIEPIYRETSGVYVFRKEVFLKYKRRIGIKPYIKEVSYKEAVDINTAKDFELAVAMLDASL